jgi:hypothetical protein
MDSPMFTWVTSSYSSQGNCVEIAARDSVLVRDTKDRQGPVLTFSADVWRKFGEHLKADASLASDAVL